MVIDVCAASDKGRYRDQNEDYYKFFKFDDGHFFLAIADGVGGHEKGEVASKLAIQQTLSYYKAYFNIKRPSSELLEEAFRFANETIVRLSEKEGHLSKMGSTLSALVFYQKNAFIVHVGDTRIYHINEDKMLLLTTDHNLETMIKRKKDQKFSRTKTIPKNVLTQSMGIKYGLSVQVLKRIKFEEGDYFLLTTDGVHGVVEDSTMKKVLLENEFEKVPYMLIELAEKMGSKDNMTCMVVKIVKKD